MSRLEKFLGWTAVLLAVGAILICLPGCTTMEAPKTFNDRVAYGYASIAAARNTAAGMIERKRLTKAQAVEVQKLADNARGLLDAARATYAGGDIKTAEGQLALALDILTALETRLKTLEAK